MPATKTKTRATGEDRSKTILANSMRKAGESLISGADKMLAGGARGARSGTKGRKTS